MAKIPFWKMHGSGNDFVVIDHRHGFIPEAERSSFVRAVCRRKIGVGADGLIFLEGSKTVDFRWRFFNADGSEAEMCGNGGRCAARFATLSGIAPPQLAFETQAGIIHAEVKGRRVKLELSRPHGLKLNLAIPVADETWLGHFINTGVPHVVLPVPDPETAPITEVGRSIRFHDLFAPAGTNVNFIKILGPREIKIRTYERGVEDETLACGTGAVASALIAAQLENLDSPVSVHTRSGEILTIYFTRETEGFAGVFLEGEALVVYNGMIWEDEL